MNLSCLIICYFPFHRLIQQMHSFTILLFQFLYAEIETSHTQIKLLILFYETYGEVVLSIYSL